MFTREKGVVTDIHFFLFFSCLPCLPNRIENSQGQGPYALLLSASMALTQGSARWNSSDVRPHVTQLLATLSPLCSPVSHTWLPLFLLSARLPPTL